MRQLTGKELSDNNLYENCYTYILRSNIVISLVDASLGDKDVKELAKAEAKDHACLGSLLF